MNYKIILDSCGELPEDLKNDPRFERIPLTLEVGEYSILDDETFDQKDFLEKVANCPVCPKSACPSPQRYMEAYCADAQRIYVVTLSGSLSGSYNSAVLGKNLYEETYGAKDICIIDSCSASGGMTQLAFKAIEFEEQGLTFEEISRKLEACRDEMGTYFVLDNLETLRKNGRLSNFKAVVASTLNIKPVMCASPVGTIELITQCIGLRKALKKMVEIIGKETENTEKKRLIISHCNADDRAQFIKAAVEESFPTREILIIDMAGVSSLYANDGGVIVSII